MPHGRGLPSGEHSSLAWVPAWRGRAGPCGGVQGAHVPAGVRGWPRAARQRGPPWGVEGGAAPLTSLGAGCRRRPDASMLAKKIASGTAPRTANPQGLQRWALLPSGRRAGARPPWPSMSLSPAVPRPEPTSSIRQTYPATFTSARVGHLELSPSAPQPRSSLARPLPKPKLRGRPARSSAGSAAPRGSLARQGRSPLGSPYDAGPRRGRAGSVGALGGRVLALTRCGPLHPPLTPSWPESRAAGAGRRDGPPLRPFSAPLRRLRRCFGWSVGASQPSLVFLGYKDTPVRFGVFLFLPRGMFRVDSYP